MALRHRTTTSLTPERNSVLLRNVDDPENALVDVTSTKISRQRSSRVSPPLLMFALTAAMSGASLMSLSRASLDDPALLAQNQTALMFRSAANGMAFELPTDAAWARLYAGLAGDRRDAPHYMRGIDEIEARGRRGGCGGALEVLEWLTGAVSAAPNATLMMAGGSLIHMHREKEFVHDDGTFIDDDFDMWASLEALSRVAELEPRLFGEFGWTARPIVTEPARPWGWPFRRSARTRHDGYVVLVQVMAACGVNATDLTGKVQSSEPGIELYPLVALPREAEGSRAPPLRKDLWQGNVFAESYFFPAKNVTFVSSKAPYELHLQLPNQPIRLMECLYGNWQVPSSEHAGEALDCSSGYNDQKSLVQERGTSQISF